MLFVTNFIELFMESAPWLMLGLFVAGLMKAFVPAQLMAKHLGSNGFMATVKAALFGAPLPLCSCGVIPAALGLRRSGASRSSTVSFLISTPETGVDSISISYALLGPFMAIIRPIAAIISAITAGVLAGTEPEEPATVAEQSSNESSCCSKQKNKQTSEEQPLSFSGKVSGGLNFTFNNLIADIAVWLIVGLSFAAMVKTFVPTEFLTEWGDGFSAFAVMALVGVPMYICATASTPIAAGLLFSGVSPGAVLVFMLAGPATNVATIGLVKTELGNRALMAYLTSVIGVAFIFGYLTNYLVAYWSVDIVAQTQHSHELLAPFITYITTAVLVIFMVRGLYGKYLKLEARS